MLPDGRPTSMNLAVGIINTTIISLEIDLYTSLKSYIKLLKWDFIFLNAICMYVHVCKGKISDNIVHVDPLSRRTGCRYHINYHPMCRMQISYISSIVLSKTWHSDLLKITASEKVSQLVSCIQYGVITIGNQQQKLGNISKIFHTTAGCRAAKFSEPAWHQLFIALGSFKLTYQCPGCKK